MAISFVGGAEGSSAPNTATSVDIGALSLGSDSAPTAGDFIVAAFAVGDDDGVDSDIAAPTLTGVTFSEQADLAVTADGDDVDLAVFTGFYAGSDTTLDWAAVGGTDASNASIVMVFRGVAGLDTTTTTATGQDAAHANPPEINHSNLPGIWTVIVGAASHVANAGGFTNPSGYTTDAFDIFQGDTNDVTLGMGYNTAPSDPENPGAMTHASTAATNSWAAVTLALQPETIIGHFDFSDATTIFEDAARTNAAEAEDTILGVTDLSGAGNHASTTSEGPTWKASIQNGLSVAQFNGADDRLESAMSTSQRPVTLFAVASFDDYSTVGTIQGASASGGLQWRVAQTTGVMDLVKQVTAGIGSSSTGLDTATFYILAATYDGVGNFAFYVNGAADGTGTNNQALTAARTLVLGRNADAGDEWLDGYLGEFRAYNYILDSTELSEVYDELAAKWGLEAAVVTQFFPVIVGV